MPAPRVAAQPMLTGDAPAAASSSPPASSPLVVDETPAQRLARYQAFFRSPRHHPRGLDEPARPTRLAPGAYACRVSKEYRLRDCTVERDADGRTFLEFAEGNLLGMRGLLVDQADGIEFEGWLTEEQPFGCSSCQDRCIEQPGSCGCDPLPGAGVVECVAQPLRMRLRAVAGRYRGTLTYRVYFNEYVGEGPARHAEGFVAKEERFEVELVAGRPPGSAPKR